MTVTTISTVSTGGTPNIESPAVIPINSVTSVSQFTRLRSRSENQPQKDPNAEKIASAWPCLVTAPKRTGHFLDKIGDGTEQDQKPDEVIPELCPGCRVRGDTAGIVIRNHHDKTGPASNR